MIYNNIHVYIVEKDIKYLSLYSRTTNISLSRRLSIGMTSVGGGAVAFPVMTLVLNVDASVARDFSLLIQGTGMSAAAFAIFFQGVMVEWHSLITCTVTGVIGLIFGLHVIDPVLSPAQKKLIFVSLWYVAVDKCNFMYETTIHC